jgi:deoxycytidylate deaminase
MNTKVLNRSIALSYSLCPINQEYRTSHIAFLVKNGKIVKIGWNKNKTTPKNLHHPYHSGRTGIHAEMSAIIKSGKDDLSNYEMIVIRVNREGKIANSCPCVGCKSVLKQFGINDVWYSNQQGNVVKMI